MDMSVPPDALPPAGRWMRVKQLLRGEVGTASYSEAEHRP